MKKIILMTMLAPAALLAASASFAATPTKFIASSSFSTYNIPIKLVCQAFNNASTPLCSSKGKSYKISKSSGNVPFYVHANANGNTYFNLSVYGSTQTITYFPDYNYLFFSTVGMGPFVCMNSPKGGSIYYFQFSNNICLRASPKS